MLVFEDSAASINLLTHCEKVIAHIRNYPRLNAARSNSSVVELLSRAESLVSRAEEVYLSEPEDNEGLVERCIVILDRVNNMHRRSSAGTIVDVPLVAREILVLRKLEHVLAGLERCIPHEDHDTLDDHSDVPQVTARGFTPQILMVDELGFARGSGDKGVFADTVTEGTVSATEDVAPARSVVDDDPVNHPKHYTSHPSGVECIDIIQHYPSNIGNVIKYVWRSGLKDGNSDIQDLRKAEFYLKAEIARLES